MDDIEYFNINNKSLIYYSRIGRLDVATKLLSTPKIKIDYQNIDDNTALIYASRHGYYDVVKKLLESKADCNIQGGKKMTALMWASRNRRVEIVKLLLDYKSYYHLKDIQSRTALMLAYDIKCAKCRGKNERIIKILTNYETNQLRRSLFLVCPSIYNDIIDMIIKFVVKTH